MIKQINCKEIKDYLKKNSGGVLLDVRTQEELDNDGKPDGDKIGLRTYFLEIQRTLNKYLIMQEMILLDPDKIQPSPIQCQT